MNKKYLAMFVVLLISAVASAGELDAHFDALARYEYGQDRTVLQAINTAINRTHDDPTARHAIEKRLVAIVENDEATTDAKAVACEMLSRISTAFAVFPVAGLLDDPLLSAQACVALERIPQGEANRALLEALDRLDGALRIGVIETLGRRGASTSIPRLAALLDEPPYAAAAALALGAIGREEASSTLALARAQQGPNQALEAGLLRCTEGLIAGGNHEQAAHILDFLYRDGSTTALQTAGFTGLLQWRPDDANRLLAEALHTGTPHFVEAALHALAMPETADAVAAALAATLPELDAATQAVFIKALAARDDEAAAKAASPLLRTGVEEAEDAVPAAAPDDPMFPDGYRMAAYLNCGVQEHSSNAHGPVISLVSGLSHAFPNIDGAVGTVAFGNEQVVYEVSGLDPDGDYVLGFTWWDVDNVGRVQSVRFGVGEEPAWQTVLPPTPPLAFNNNRPTWARVLLPLAAPYDAVETLRVAFVKEGGGPNVAVNELWLLERVAPAKARRVLIVTGDDYAGHDWQRTAPALAALLREDDRLEVSITEAPVIYGSPLLHHYDATIIHFKNYEDRLPLGEACWEGLTNYMAAGNGLMLTHFACGAFQEWDGFVRVAGRVWNPALRAHDPHGTFAVRMTNVEHPITGGISDFEITDELYTCLDGDAPITVLCDAVSVVDKETYPMAFIVEDTGGRVFHCVLGHDVVAYEAPGARNLYLRAAAWVAGLDPLEP